MAYRLNIVELNKVPLAEDFLTKRELGIYKTFKIDKRKKEWLGGRYALKKLACDFFNFDIKHMEVNNLPSGQPVLLVPGGTKLPVSITHSGAYAAAAIALTGQAIGLDIEVIEQRSPAWIKQCFEESEISSKSAPFLTELWAKKEAVLKFLGVGLKLSCTDINFVFGKLEFKGKALDMWARQGSPNITLQVQNLQGSYKLAIASEEPRF
ncbi:MAG: 4'-phosphopantetheinyl transferase superfamily protein [Elusimicrobiaceae bacterium]|nr:4'-phosphopantetheinyl transferase superfamily protein [Elusimicrobiaceae bacterium]